MGEAEADEALGESAAAAPHLRAALRDGAVAADDLLMRLGKAAYAAGDTAKAREAFARVYYEFAVSDLAPVRGYRARRGFPCEPTRVWKRARTPRAADAPSSSLAGESFAAARSAFERLRARRGGRRSRAA